MKTISAKYKGDCIVELPENIDLPEDSDVFVIIPDEDEDVMRKQLQAATESVFQKLWNNKKDEVWSEYL